MNQNRWCLAAYILINLQWPCQEPKFGDGQGDPTPNFFGFIWYSSPISGPLWPLKSWPIPINDQSSTTLGLPDVMGEAASGFAGGIFTLPSEMMGGINWLVVSTPLKKY
jgi:hypothetical protein